MLTGAGWQLVAAFPYSHFGQRPTTDILEYLIHTVSGHPKEHDVLITDNVCLSCTYPPHSTAS